MRRICVLAGLVLGCSPSPEVATARLVLRALPSCELASAGELTVRASGDFPSEQYPVDPSAAPAFDDFLPPDTLWLAIESNGDGERAGSLVARQGGDQQASALMLPFGRSCPLGDPLAAALPGAAIAALPAGGLLIAGGQEQDGTAAVAHAAVLPPGAALARAVPRGMLLRRAGASATAVGTRVVIAGGGADSRGSAHDTFEVYEQASDAFDAAQSANLTGGPRRDHGAALLPDGRVLIAGGVRELAGEPLASAELIELAGVDSRELDEGLVFARTAPQLLTLDDGTVIVALGRDARDNPVREVERFVNDPDEPRFEQVDALLPAHPHSAVAALEGKRVAYVGCFEPNVLAATCELHWLLPDADGDGFVPLASTLAPEALARAGLSGLRDLRAAALGDGRVLVTGRVLWDAVPRRAFVIDPGGPSVERVDASRVPDRLIALADGALAEIAADGASLRRQDVQSELDDPPDPLPLDPGTLALDAAERWSPQRDGALEALAPARFDVPRLRFAAVRVELEVEGEAHLLLEPAGAAAVEIHVASDRLSVGGCSLERAGASAIAIERDGERVTLQSEDRTRRCSAPRLGERVGIALRAAAPARIRALRIVRL
jgi:hypothetical protein